MSAYQYPTSTLHVIFGTGPMGTGIARELLKRGQTVRMVNRSGRQPLDLPPVEVCAGDAYNADFVRDMTQGAAVVYQAAQPEYHQWVTHFPQLQDAIVAGLTAAGSSAESRPRLAVVENLYMYGQADGPMREDTPYNAHTRKGKVRAAMAESLLATHRAGALRVVMARGSDFFGPNDPVSGGFHYQPALAGRTVNGYGNIDAPHTATFTEDFARALVMLAAQDDTFGQAWHVPNAPTISQRAYLNMIFAAAGTTPKINAVSPLMMRLVGVFSTGAREMVEMMYQFAGSFVVDHSKFAARFGTTGEAAPTPLDEAVRRTVAWFRAHPEFGH